MGTAPTVTTQIGDYAEVDVFYPNGTYRRRLPVSGMAANFNWERQQQATLWGTWKREGKDIIVPRGSYTASYIVDNDTTLISDRGRPWQKLAPPNNTHLDGVFARDDYRDASAPRLVLRADGSDEDRGDFLRVIGSAWNPVVPDGDVMIKQWSDAKARQALGGGSGTYTFNRFTLALHDRDGRVWQFNAYVPSGENRSQPTRLVINGRALLHNKYRSHHMFSFKSTAFTLLILGTFLATAVPAYAGFISHIDLAPLPKLDSAECPKTGAEPLASNAPHTIEGLIGGATLNYSQALNNLSSLLEASVSNKATEALQADTLMRDPQHAASVAAAALVEQQPLAALALLLQANQSAPNDPLYLINLAGLSNHLGLHREALAMVGAAEKKTGVDARIGGMHMRAVLLSNKGYALNATGRPKEAEAALNEAIKLEPDLAEAYTNMGFALGDQDKCPLAARYARAGKTRRPQKVLADSELPEQKQSQRLPLAEVIDLSRGRAGVLPAMHLASSPEDADQDTLKTHLAKLMDTEATQRAQQKQLEFSIQALGKRSAWAEQGPIGVLSSGRAEWLVDLSMALAEETAILLQMAGTPDQLGSKYELVMHGERPEEAPKHLDPELQPRVNNSLRATLEMLADRENAREAFSQRREMVMKTYQKEQEACSKRKDSTLCVNAAMLRRDAAICGLAKEAASQRMGSAMAYAADFRELYGESFRRLTGVASYFSEPSHLKEAEARINWFAHHATSLLAAQVEGHRSAQAIGAAECRASNKRMVDLLLEYLADLEAHACQSGGKSAGLSVGAASVSANCEEVSVSASTPGWLGLFAKVSYEQSKRYEFVRAGKERFLAQQAGLDPKIKLHVPEYGTAFDGKLTVYAGGQAQSPVGGVTAQGGGYVEFNGNGDVTGYGRQTDVSKSSSVSPGAGVSGSRDSTIYTSRTPMFSPSHSSSH